jgi:mannose-6-phosphate isomerase-like protein (cupin superfamily)
MNSDMTRNVRPLDSVAVEPGNVRRMLFTGPHRQLVVLSLEAGESIGKERHPALDQLLRVEHGVGEVVFNDTERHMRVDGGAILVPAGTWHYVINMSSSTPLTLDTLYAPPNHAGREVNRSKADAGAAVNDLLARLCRDGPDEWNGAGNSVRSSEPVAPPPSVARIRTSPPGRSAMPGLASATASATTVPSAVGPQRCSWRDSRRVPARDVHDLARAPVVVEGTKPLKNDAQDQDEVRNALG